MAHVVLCSDCLDYTGGLASFDVEAGNVRALFTALEARFPGLGGFVDKKMAVAIDGEIHQDAWFSALTPQSEVYLIPKIGGG